MRHYSIRAVNLTQKRPLGFPRVRACPRGAPREDGILNCAGIGLAGRLKIRFPDQRTDGSTFGRKRGSEKRAGGWYL